MSNFERDCGILFEEQMKNLKTRQLLTHLRHTYRWGDYDWEDAEAMGLSKGARTHISRVCKGLEQSAGKHPITKEKLHWKYYEGDK